MITLTPEAAKQVQESARQSGIDEMPLRIAVQRREDGAFHYGMGFEENVRDDDLRFTTEGIHVVVAPSSIDLLNGTVLDFAQLDSGEFQFIFRNPNDPTYKPAAKA